MNFKIQGIAKCDKIHVFQRLHEDRKIADDRINLHTLRHLHFLRQLHSRSLAILSCCRYNLASLWIPGIQIIAEVKVLVYLVNTSQLLQQYLRLLGIALHDFLEHVHACHAQITHGRGKGHVHQQIAVQQVIELFAIDAHGDVPFLGIPLKTDGGYVDVLSRIGMLSIQTADDRIFLPEMFLDDTVKTILSKIKYMRPSATCHDVTVMVQEVHVEVLVLIDSHRHLQLLVGLFIERKRAFRRKIQRHTGCEHG